MVPGRRAPYHDGIHGPWHPRRNRFSRALTATHMGTSLGGNTGGGPENEFNARLGTLRQGSAGRPKVKYKGTWKRW